MLRAILFDFNGVLVDDEPIHFRMVQRVLAEEGIALDEAEYYRDLLGHDDRGCFLKVLSRSGAVPSPQQLLRLVARKASYYQDLVHRQGYPFFPGAVQLIGAAAERGWMLGVVSGALREEVEGALRQAGVRERFKVVVAAEDVSACKPEPEGYRQAIEALNSRSPLPERLLHAHEVLAVEDSEAGLRAAGGAGCVTLAVGHTEKREQLVRADAWVERLELLTVDRLVAVVAAAGAAEGRTS